MNSHAAYVIAAYVLSGLTLIVLIGWLLVDQTLRRRDLAALEQQGVRRRSERKST